MKNFLLSFLFLSFSFALQAQEIRVQVLDKNSREPVPYANIIFSESGGTVTNEEGFFSISEARVPEKLKILSLGYEEMEVKTSEIDDTPILLVPSSIELGEIFLSNKNLPAEEIIEKVNENIAKNYSTDLSKNRIFFRHTNTSILRKLDLEVDESTIAGIDQQHMDRMVAKIPKESTSYKEVIGDLYGNYKYQKLQVIKAADLENPYSEQSLDQPMKYLEILFRDNLKEESFLKIRSGISLGKITAGYLDKAFADIDAERREKTPEELVKEVAEKRKSIATISDRSIYNLLLENMFWMEDSDFDVFQESNRHRFSLEGFAKLDGQRVYVINFEPKRRGNFSGKIFVNALDYGVHRIDFQNEKPLKIFSLLGVSMRDDVLRGKMIFVKDSTEKYRPKYLEQVSGETFVFNRPLTIIEKNKKVPGRNKQNELDLDLDLRMSYVDRLQLVIYENSPLGKDAFNQVGEDYDFDYTIFKTYDHNFWKGHNILEPNEAIKKFTVLEQE